MEDDPVWEHIIRIWDEIAEIKSKIGRIEGKQTRLEAELGITISLLITIILLILKLGGG